MTDRNQGFGTPGAPFTIQLEAGDVSEETLRVFYGGEEARVHVRHIAPIRLYAATRGRQVLIENFEAREESRPMTQELRAALHSFFVENPDLRAIELTVYKDRK